MSTQDTQARWSETVPKLEHWVTLREVASGLGISRQQAHNMARAGRFKSLRKLAEEGRAIFVIKVSELEQISARRARVLETSAADEEDFELEADPTTQLTFSAAQ